MQPWTQVYDPLGNLWLSSLIAAAPIIFFFVALALVRMKGYIAATITALLTLLVAVLVYGMPVRMAVASGAYGFAIGLWPISWIIVAVVFLYKVTVKAGQFDIIRASVISITEDQRLQMLMVGFSFGAFLEGAAGFGAPVAITAGLLVGLGFRPLYAAGLCLIANTAPVAFGAMGTPIIMAGRVTGIDPMIIGAMAGRQLPFLSVVVPFWIVLVMDGKKGVREIWPAVLVAGGSFAVCQFLTSNFIGPELPDVLSALVSLVSTALFLKIWQPKSVFRFSEEEAELERAAHKYTSGQILKAWSPFLILTVMVTIWSLPWFKALFAKGGPLEASVITFAFPWLHNLVIKAAPIVANPTPFAARYELDLLSATGTAIFFSAIISAAFLRLKLSQTVATFGETLRDLAWPIYTIGTVVSFAFIANYSGIPSTVALLLAGTGALYPFFSPVLGWLGVFLTGSDTSSNALFSNLQTNTAHQIGVSDVLLVAANSTGGVTGKMISPQSIAVACAATGLVGSEASLFRFTVKHSLLMVTVAGIVTVLQAYVFRWMVP